MKGAFLRTSASRIAAPFFGKVQGGLNKGSYLSEAIQGLLTPIVGRRKARHTNEYIYLCDYVKKKMHVVKKYFPFGRVDRKRQEGSGSGT